MRFTLCDMLPHLRERDFYNRRNRGHSDGGSDVPSVLRDARTNDASPFRFDNLLTMRPVISNPPATRPSESMATISREALNELPLLRYEGPVHVIAGQPDLQRALEDILAESVVGFDTEARPAFRAGENYLPSIVQFATARAVYLLQAKQPELFGAMRDILSSEGIVKAGVSVADDIRTLRMLFEFHERSVVDLGRIAKRHGLKQTGVRNLAGMFLGARIAKGAKTTNWAAPRLTPRQIAYAATDAWVCRELYLRFTELKMIRE